MALVGFPNQIEVTAGAGWIGTLTPTEIIVLTKVTQDKWSEDGTELPSASNRVITTFISGVSRRAVIAAATSGFSVTIACGNSGILGTGDYSFLSVWSGATSGSFYAYISTGADYNPDVWSLMREYAPEPPAGHPAIKRFGGVPFVRPGGAKGVQIW